MIPAVYAIIATYNEVDVLDHCLNDLRENGVTTVVIDEGSTDGTNGMFADVFIESPEKEFDLRRVMRKKEELTKKLVPPGANVWFINADADEFRESPWPGLTLAQAIERVDKEGYNAIDFEIYNFIHDPENPWHGKVSPKDHFTRWQPSDLPADHLQIRAWKHQPKIELESTGGHEVKFEGRKVYPIKFICRHYPLRSKEHEEKKLNQDRRPRYSKEELAKGWHVQYDQKNDHPLVEWNLVEEQRRLLKGRKPRTDVVINCARFDRAPYGDEAFKEVAEVLCHTLRDMGHDSDIKSNRTSNHGPRIILGWHLGNDSSYDSDCIIYNMEQLQGWNATRPGTDSLVVRLKKLSKRCQVWDYCQSNIDIMEKEGVYPVLVPLGTHPILKRIKHAKEKDIPFLFYGSLNKRRKGILQKLIASGLNIHIAENVWGEERDALIARTQTVLNIHYYENAPLETARLAYLLANDVEVFSEYCEELSFANVRLVDVPFRIVPPEIIPKQWLPVIEKKTDRPHVCLTMIVKNDKGSDESHVISRCIDSVRPIISSASFMLTARDEHAEIPKAIYALENLHVGLMEWKDDFAEARNMSMALSQGDWNMWMDADEILELKGQGTWLLDKLASTRANSIAVPMILSSGRVKPKVLFTRRDPKFKWVWPLHEELVYDDKRLTGVIMFGDPEHPKNGIHVWTPQDGARTKAGDKLKRDLDVMKNLDHPRYLFYSAETCRVDGHLGRASEFFTEFIKSEPGEGYLPHVYYSHLMLGRYYNHMFDSDEARWHFQTAYQLCPTRAEALGELALLESRKGNWAMARLYAMGCVYAFKPEQTEFLETEWQQWKGLDLLIGILTSLKQYPLALSYYDILLSREIPEKEKARIASNFINLKRCLK